MPLPSMAAGFRGTGWAAMAGMADLVAEARAVCDQMYARPIRDQTHLHGTRASGARDGCAHEARVW